MMHDEDGIIGTRPKAKPVDLGPLFADAAPPILETHDPKTAPVIAHAETNDAGEVVARFVEGAGEIVRQLTEREIPEDPTRPEPPTKAERLAAIEKVKAEVVGPLVARARKRIGLPLPSAGVTADDVWELAQSVPAAALVGAGARAWSWTGPWLGALARAGALAPFYVETVPVTRRATVRDESHGNPHRVYLHPEDPRAPGGARSQRPDA
jgi:hypothetical protein